ncbi:MAG TPA: helix-turn-helix transcriptional regulator [Streptosporangiaceae bacterium]|nr:helix-turn-helix transcriptional regulator [Streptosporangiaceae bacterium]
MSEFGEHLGRVMAERGIGVRELARQLPCNPGYLSNLRSGRKRPSRSMAARLDELLAADGALVVYALSFSGQTGDSHADVLNEAARRHLHDLSMAQVEALTDHLAGQWHALVKTDNLLGPRYALGSVRTHLAAIEGLLRVVRGPARQRVLGLAARYAESAAWLHDDSGDLAAARYWAGRAMEWAVEGDERLMVSWTLFRRSQQAMASGDAAQVASLASAARREAAGGLGGPGMAAILQQEAHACALDGAEVECHRLLDSADALAAAPDDPGDASGGHGSFCTPAYLEMQRGVCWLTLRQPAKAAAVLEAAAGSLPAVYRRDRGVALSSQAAALAAMGEPVAAATVGMRALEIARDSGSGRILRMILPVSAGLAAHSALEEVRALQGAVTASLAA